MTDYIDRQAAICAIEEYADRLQMVNWKENPGVPYKAHALNWVINTLRDLPSAEVEPVKHGRWIVVSDGYGNGDATAHICECSECKDTIWVYKKATRRWNYCPNCGAKMENEDEL